VVLDHQGPDRTNPDIRRVRLVEGALPVGSAPGPRVGDAIDTNPKGDKKAKKGAKTAKLRDPRTKQGHAKKVKATTRLAAELQGLSGTLSELRGRLSDLHAVQMDSAESSAVLFRQVETLDGLAVAERERGERLVGRLDQLTQTVDALGARVAVGSAPSAALEALAGRIARAESALARLQGQATAEGSADRVLGELEGRLAALQGLLDTQGGRLQGLERDVHVARLTQARPEGSPWEGEVRALQHTLDVRIQGLAEGLRQSQADTLHSVEESRSWTRARLSRLGRRQTLALGLVGLLAVGLLAAEWWRTERLAFPDTAQMESPEQRLGGLRSGEPGVSTLVSQDLLERMRHMESGLVDSARDLEAARQAAEGGTGRLADLVGGQRALTERIDTLQRNLSETDKGLAVLNERLSGLTRPAQPSLASRAVPPDSLPVEGPRYAVQLVAYHSRARVAPFVEQYGIGDQAVVTEARVGGRRAYVVLLGPFGSESEASQAMSAFPPELRALGPWVRRLSAGTRLEPWR